MLLKMGILSLWLNNTGGKKMAVTVGIKGEKKFVVSEEMMASKVGSGGVLCGLRLKTS